MTTLARESSIEMYHDGIVMQAQTLSVGRVQFVTFRMFRKAPRRYVVFHDNFHRCLHQTKLEQLCSESGSMLLSHDFAVVMVDVNNSVYVLNWSWPPTPAGRPTHTSYQYIQ